MRNIRLILEYEGTGYAGWQVQENAPTIQGALEEALAVLLKAPTRVTGSGRTDAGVHALAQVANFHTDGGVPLRGFVHGLNGLLPRDITVRRAEEVPLDFDARRSAKEKTYQYFLHLAPTPSAFARRTSWRVWPPPDLDAMGRAGAHLVGTHDFGAFRSAGCDAPHAVREIREIQVKARGEFAEVAVRGTAFLRHMVRIIVGTLVEAGQGRRDPDSVPALLASGNRGAAGPTAPAQGLFLAEVRYEGEPLGSYP